MIEVALAEHGTQSWLGPIYGSVDISENESRGTGLIKH